MRILHLDKVRSKKIGCFTVSEIVFSVGIAFSSAGFLGAEVHFVYIQRRAVIVAFFRSLSALWGTNRFSSALQPAFVVPFVFFDVADDRRGLF